MNITEHIDSMLIQIRVAKQKAEADVQRLNVKDKHLRITRNHGTWQYYVIEPGTGRNGKYLPVSQRKIAEEIAQCNYAMTTLKTLGDWEDRLNLAKTVLSSIPPEGVASLHVQGALHPGRAELIRPYQLNDAEYASEWQRKPYRTKGIGPDWPVIVSARGEQVRSKSEKIIADRLDALGIPYRYEAPLTLKGGIRFHPDFTILDVANRKEVYLEHLGMLTLSKYAAENVDRVKRYAKSGFVQGEDIFYTFECEGHPITTAQIDSIVMRFVPGK